MAYTRVAEPVDTGTTANGDAITSDTVQYNSSSTSVATTADVVDVVEVSGDLDGITVDFITRSIGRSTTQKSLALVLQVNSTRTTASTDRIAALADLIATSEVPVTMWVGPSGARAEGAIAQLAGLADDLAVAPGSELGALGPLIVPQHHLSESFSAAYTQLYEDTVSSEKAIELGLAREAPTLPFFVLDLPGFRTEVNASSDKPVRIPVSRVRFAKLAPVEQFMHTSASPAVAYLLLLVGGVLLVLEFYTAGVGIAGVSGAIAFMLGCYGLAAQPVRIWAVALLAVAVFGYCVDIQAGAPRVWTAIASVCLTFGSLMLFDGRSLSWITLTAGIGGVSLAMVAGMPTMVRTRFATPTMGREWLTGALGTAVESVDPEGVVVIEDGSWMARTHRSTPIPAGARVKVTGIEGRTLMVTPASAPDDDTDLPNDEQ